MTRAAEILLRAEQCTDESRRADLIQIAICLEYLAKRGAIQDPADMPA